MKLIDKDVMPPVPDASPRTKLRPTFLVVAAYSQQWIEIACMSPPTIYYESGILESAPNFIPNHGAG